MTDVSRNTVAILVILVIVVSGFGTWSLLTNTATMERPSAGQQGQPSVGLAVQPQPKNVGYIRVEVEPANG